jgi:hypothetical protein
MKTPTDITARLYTMLNISGIKALADGGVHRDSLPEQLDNISTSTCVIINCVYSNNLPVNEAVANINIYTPDLANGTPNLNKLSTLTSLIIDTIDAYLSTSDYFIVDQYQVNMYRGQNERTFNNIRLDLLTD